MHGKGGKGHGPLARNMDPRLITLHYITLSSFHTPFTPKVTSGASTELSMSGIVCECKQMSFQLLFEKNKVSVSCWETKRKFIPSLGSGVGEASFAELYHVGQVARSTADVHQMHKFAQFDCYAILNWKPV